MSIPIGVIAFYGALVVWFGLLVLGWRRRRYDAFLVFGVALLLVLNGRYFDDGAPNSIAFFNGIYDVLHNAGVPQTAGAAKPDALAECPGNACSVWGAFWLFRVMEFVMGPLLRNHDTVSLLICIWFSAPLGMALAELIRRRGSRSGHPAWRAGGRAGHMQA